MTKIEAIRGSIQKWEAIVEGTGVDRGSSNCALCQKYNNRTTGIPCIGCPVPKIFCDKTPYKTWILHQHGKHSEFDTETYRVRCDKCKVLAQKEVDYLSDILNIELLKKSIKKWEDIREGTKTDLGSLNCALCQEYNGPNTEIPCEGCPIERLFCRVTPYEMWTVHHNVKHSTPGPKSYKVRCDECKVIAQQEIDFLKYILKKAERNILCNE